jgi:drug/metabolite transporter (DMT)-like permease
MSPDVSIGSEARGAGRAALLLGLVIVLWGVNWPIMKVGLQFMPPLWFATIRIFLGALTLFALLLVTRRLQPPPRADLPIVLSVGLLQIAAFLGLTHFALKFVEAGRSAILAYTTPLWVVPLSALLLHEPIGRARLVALALGMGGVVVLFNPLAVDYGNTKAVLGNALLLASALVWAAAIVHVRGHRWQASPLELMPWQMLLGGSILLPLAAITEPAPAIDWSPELAVILAYNGPIASAFCYWAFVTVNRTFEATTTSLGSLGVPVVGVLVSALTLGETLTAAKVGGLALIAAGVAVLTLAGGGDH